MLLILAQLLHKLSFTFVSVISWRIQLAIFSSSQINSHIQSQIHNSQGFLTFLFYSQLICILHISTLLQFTHFPATAPANAYVAPITCP